jgi:hypothetical protein
MLGPIADRVASRRVGRNVTHPLNYLKRMAEP